MAFRSSPIIIPNLPKSNPNRKPEVGGRKPEVGCRMSDVGCQISEIRSMRSEVTISFETWITNSSDFWPPTSGFRKKKAVRYPWQPSSYIRLPDKIKFMAFSDPEFYQPAAPKQIIKSQIPKSEILTMVFLQSRMYSFWGLSYNTHRFYNNRLPLCAF